MSRESRSDKETEAGLTSECWTTLHILYPSWELSTLFVFAIRRAYNLQRDTLKQWSKGELLWGTLLNIFQGYNVISLKNIKDISVTKVIQVFSVCVERLRACGGFNVWAAFIWVAPHVCAQRWRERKKNNFHLRTECFSFLGSDENPPFT